MQREINDFVEYTVSYENQQKEGVWVTFVMMKFRFQILTVL